MRRKWEGRGRKLIKAKGRIGLWVLGGDLGIGLVDALVQDRWRRIGGKCDAYRFGAREALLVSQAKRR